MPEFMMFMKGGQNTTGWDAYIQSLIESGHFRGGSALGNGKCMHKSHPDGPCSVTGFMRFEADSREQITALVMNNPTYQAGDPVEILELIEI